MSQISFHITNLSTLDTHQFIRADNNCNKPILIEPLKHKLEKTHLRNVSKVGLILTKKVLSYYF